MNILIPHSWLKEHLESAATPQEIQNYLSLCGPSVERIYDREGEPVYDIEITTNRVDAMSVRGVAREAAIILRQFNIEATLRPLQTLSLEDIKPETEELPLPKITNNSKYCTRTLCVILKDVQSTPTPDWMAKRLTQLEANVHNSLIDITNYVTHELGHPCHAFDYDKIMSLGGEIIVVEAEAGKKFITLDGEEYTTVGGEIVFENPDGEIIDIPAVKGTLNSSINENTKNVLLWIESIDPKKVRFTSMTHAIRTVAAQLEEKNVDPNLADIVMLRGIELYQQLCHAKIASQLHDNYPKKRKSQTIEVKQATLDDYLGIKLEPAKIKSILEALECKVEIVDDNKEFKVTPPTFRPDLKIPADIVEEIARIYGYHNLPSVVMPTEIPLIKPKHTNFRLEEKIKHFLANIGWQEVYTYSMLGEEIAQLSGYQLDEHLKLANPLTDDKVYLRRSLVPSLETVINQNSQQNSISVFELAHIYHPQNKTLPQEEMRLTLVSNRDYRLVKGDAEILLKQLFINRLVVKPMEKAEDPYHQQAIVEIAASADESWLEIGVMGVLKSGRIAIDLNLSKLLGVAQTHPQYQPAPKTSVIIEDLTFTLPTKTSVGPIIELIGKVDQLITKVRLGSVYQQNFTFGITYHHPDKNITGEDIKSIRRKIIDQVSAQFDAKLVGTV